MQFKQLFLLMMSGYFAGASLQVHAESRDLLTPKIVVASVYAGIGIVGFFGLKFLCKKEAKEFKSMAFPDKDTFLQENYERTKEAYSEESQLKKHFSFVEILEREKEDVSSSELDEIKKDNEGTSDFSVERLKGTFACKGKYHYSHGEFKRSVYNFKQKGKPVVTESFEYNCQKACLRPWVKAVGGIYALSSLGVLAFCLKK